jgi:diguanylate cyclase (GGDEF)-like protein/PAS domain S-box-containing protein
MALLAVYLLGAFQARIDDRNINTSFKTEKERALLAYLAVETRRAHTRESLAELLWPNRSEGIGRADLRQALCRLRRAIQDAVSGPSFLLVNNETIQINPDSNIWVDSAAFGARILFTRRHAHSRLEECSTCACSLQEALDLYRGDFLVDLNSCHEQEFREWTLINKEQHFQDRLYCLHTLSLHYQQRQDYERSLSYAHQHIVQSPIEERAYRQVMRLLTLQGRRNAALEHYEHCAAVVKKELGVAPAPETTALYQQIKSGQFSRPQPAPASQHFPAAQIPHQLTGFIGREKELDWLSSELKNPAFRLFAITGMPGAGKTRLALEAAARIKGDFEWVRFVCMNGVTACEEMLMRLGRTLGLHSAAPSPTVGELARAASCSSMLLVDGFEGLVAETDQLLELLHLAPGLKILLTSRKRLNYQVALEIELEGLAYPTQGDADRALQFPAVQLFLSRARAHQRQFNPEKVSLPLIVQISQRLGGNPLAVELAAARLHDLSLEQLAAALESSLVALQTRLVDVPSRQHSLSAIFDELWKGLSPRKRNALRRLAVFPAHFTLEAAGQVAGAGPDLLSALCDDNLIQCALGDGSSWHPLLHQYASQKLSRYPLEERDLRTRHARFYLAYMNNHEQMLRQRQQVIQTLEAITIELENIDQALKWAVAEQYEQAADYFASRAYYQELRENLEQSRVHLPRQEHSHSFVSSELVESFIFSPILVGNDSCCGRTGLFEDSLRAILLIDSNSNICSANYQASQLSGHTRTQLRGLPLVQLMPRMDIAGMECRLDGPLNTQLKLQNGRLVPVQFVCRKLEIGEAAYTLVILVEPTLCLASESDINSLADPLTSLPNRDQFFLQMRQSLSQAARMTRQVAVLLLDIDNLRDINRTLGDSAGDTLLQSISFRLRNNRRGEDFLARIGSDEFAVLLENPPCPQDMLRLAGRFLNDISRPYILAGAPVQVSVHIGISLYPEDGDNPEHLLQTADRALRTAKDHGQQAYISASEHPNRAAPAYIEPDKTRL